MSKPSRDEVLKVAGECGFDVATEGDTAFVLDSANLNMTVMLERFAAAMYAAGEEGMRERIRELDEAERTWHDYAAKCDVGAEREQAFCVFERLRVSRRTEPTAFDTLPDGYET